MVFRFTDPFSTLLSVQRATDDAMRSDWFGTRTTGRGAYPFVNVFREGEDFVIVAEMPGVDKSALDITLEKNLLTVTGTINSKAYEELEPIYTEYNVGNFSRTFTLSTQIDSSKIEASIEDGVLRIDLPKTQESQQKVRRIPVKAA